MNALRAAVLAGVLGVGMLVSIPATAAAQRELPLTSESRMRPDTTAAPLHEPPGGTYRRISTLVPLLRARGNPGAWNQH